MKNEYLISDDELIYMIKQNNKEAERLLFSCYDTKMRGILELNNKIIFSNIEEDILRSIFHNTLIEALSSYDSTRGSFYTYVAGLLYFKVIGHYRKTIKKTGFELPTDFNDGTNLLKDDNAEHFYHTVDYQFAIEKLKDYRQDTYQALMYWIQGYTYQEIAIKTNSTAKRVAYLIKTGLNWLNNHYKSHDFK